MEKRIALLSGIIILIICLYLIESRIFRPETESIIGPFSHQGNSGMIPTKLPNENARISIIAAGDLGLGREINWQIQKHGDPGYFFEKIAPVVQPSDFAFANLESPVVDSCPLTRTGMVFCGQPNNIKGLATAGFNGVNLANNHISNWGQLGVTQTKTNLAANNLEYFDSGNILYKEVKGTRLAFIGFDDISQPLDIEEVKSSVTNAQNNADIIIASFHWGQEYQDRPNERQRTLAYAAISAGANAIVGHHPHVVQTLEYYLEKPIFYSLGNFLFDQFWSEETRKGALGRIEIEDKRITNAKLIPIWINDQYQPELR